MWYRLYELDEGDHILRASTLEVPGDAEALAAAQARAGAHGMEVWQGARRVGRVEPRERAPVPAKAAS